MMNRVLFSSKDQTHRTPKVILDLVRKLGPIGLDPCASMEHQFALVNYAGVRGEADDGLAVPWRGYGLAFCNPPYSRALGPWTKKAADEFTSKVPYLFPDMENDELVLLVPARTDTRWFQENVLRCDAICFWKGRLCFVGSEASAPFPSCLAYWGPRREKFREIFAPYGWVVDR